MIRLAYRTPRLVILALLLLVISGTVGFYSRARLEDPKSLVRWGYITTRLDGATAPEIESEVTAPIERAVRQVNGIRSIESSSIPGVSIVFVRILDDVTDVNLCWSDVEDRISEVADSLSTRASQPILINDRRWNAYTSLLALIDTEDRPNRDSVLARWSKEIEDRLRFVPGTDLTERFGSPQEEILVEISEETLSLTGLSIAQIAAKIQQRDSRIPDATTSNSTQDIPIRLVGDVNSLDELRNIILRATPEGKQIRLGNVANIRRAAQHPASSIALVDDQSAVVIASRMDSNFHISEWTTSQQKVIDEIRALLPAGLSLQTLYQQKRYTDRRSSSLYSSLGLGMLFVSLIVCLMMGWRAAIPICLSLPLTILGVFFLMMPFSIDMHQMSISGLILALGILIDNPIIVVDNISRRLSNGASSEHALVESVRHVTPPLIASNSTTILAFFPILLLPGPTGEFLGQLGWTVIASLLVSLTLSLTLIPVIAAWCLDNTSSLQNSALSQQDWYSQFLTSIFRRPLLVIVFSVLLPLVGFTASLQLRIQFFPAAERDHFHFTLRLPAQATIAESKALARSARDVILNHQDVESTSLFVGSNAPKIHYSMISADDYQSNFAQGIVQLGSDEVDPIWIRDVQHELDQVLPEAQVVVSRLEQGPPAPAPIEFRILGPSREQLESLSEKARKIMMTVPGIIHTRTSMDLRGVQFGINVNQYDSTAADLSDADIAQQIYDQLQGVVLTSMREGIELIPIRVQIKDADECHPERTLSLPIISPDGTNIPLGSLAEFKINSVPNRLYRRNLSPCSIVSAYVAAGELPVALEKKFLQALVSEGFQLPPGYRFEFGGISQERKSAVGNLYGNAAIVCTLMLTLLVATFRSFRIAAIIGLVGVLSIGIGLLSLWLFQYPFGIVAIIGLLGMMGLAINDSIVVLADCQTDTQRSIPLSRIVLNATRHVLTTTLTTVAGVLPLIIAGGEFWPPMMIVIAGGVVGATLLALGLTPALYQMILRKTA